MVDNGFPSVTVVIPPPLLPFLVNWELNGLITSFYIINLYEKDNLVKMKTTSY